MNTCIFIPDTNKNVGLGHYFRCFKYSNYIKQNLKIIFLINKNFNKKYLKKKNYFNNKINYIFYNSLKKTLIEIKKIKGTKTLILDSYNQYIHKINFKPFFYKHINILDFKIKTKCDYIIDHTFKRKKNFYKNIKSKNYLGVSYFPIYRKINKLEKRIILIDFGSINNKDLIKSSIEFVKKLKLGSKYKIVVINKYINNKPSFTEKYKQDVSFYSYVKNIDHLYQKTFFSIGACGISLYEKCFYNIPSISKCVAVNQKYNFINFSKNHCIMNFDKIIKKNYNTTSKYNIFYNELKKTKKNIKKNFNLKKNKKKLITLFKILNEK